MSFRLFHGPSHIAHRLALIVAITFLFFAPKYTSAQDRQPELKTPFELGDGWDSADYDSAIRFYRTLAVQSPKVTISEMGMTDCGTPLHLVLVTNIDDADPGEIRDDPRSIMLINNAIHPGESDGVDASMAFARDLALDEESDHLEKVIVAIIPLYNIGGALNRNSGTRANQNGPRQYGFRGNARNFDLNRDFVKCDTLNARSFAQIFQLLDPDLFIDTHVSNGADYQHVMTTSHSQKDKLGLQLGDYLNDTFEPRLFDAMKRAGFHTIPYVNSGGSPPDQGFTQFLETPRYSTGYTALFQTIGFMTETHMLKPYPQRVKATRAFLDQAINLLADEGATIRRLRKEDRDAYHQQERVPIAWEVDRSDPSRLEFHGYEATYRDSRVTPGKRLFYDREKPFVRDIRYFNHYKVARSVALPKAYLVPRQWRSVIELLELNGVEFQVIEEDTSFQAEVHHIERVTTRPSPYEGHYLHDTVELDTRVEAVIGRVGDVLIPIHQDRARYVVETLEPEAMDSLFRWNFFDSILQRKEYFSPYVFEESAESLLANDEIRESFEKRKKEDSEFANDRRAQLTFLYERSKHNEKSYRRYPVVRIVGDDE